MIGIVLEVVFDRRKLNWWLILGLVLSVIGGVMAYANGLSTLGLGLGAILAFLSVAAYVIASRLTVKHLPTMTTLGSSAVTIIGAAIAVFIMTIIADFAGAPKVNWPEFGGYELLVAMVYGFGSLALSQILWVAGVKGLGVGIAAMHVNAAPFYVMVFMLALGSQWNWWQALGALVVALAVVVAQFGPQLGNTKVQAT